MGTWGAVLFALFLVLPAGCGDPPPPSARHDTVPPLLLARHPEALVALSLPETSRPGGVPAPEQMPVLGPFKLVRTTRGVQTWKAPLPFRSRKLFYSHPPPGAIVYRGDASLRFSNGPKGARNMDTWDFTQDTLILRRDASLGPPRDTDYTLAYPRASEREDGLNLDQSGLEERDFALRSLQLDDSTRTGVYLPAPGLAAWEVVIPPDAVLALDATILPPEARVGVVSDGATLVVDLDQSGTITEVDRIPLQTDGWSPIQVDLGAWAGQRAHLRLRTEPGESSDLDYVFLAEPTLYTPVSNPRRMLLVFVDTLRQDHLGIYGHERDTSPRLDAWARKGAVFEQARSVAPWTLPTTRTVLSGQQPEQWRSTPPLQERLAAAGWATGAFVGNVYLSTNFDMADGWTQHHCVNWPPAEDVIEQLDHFLDRHQDRDAMAMLHVMDMHLPYNEPRAYRTLWAGDPPGDFDASSATRTKILKAHKTEGAALEQYLLDRYDQNLRYLDDQLGALLDRLGPEVTVVLFADHGEEFWDHGDFEHGHSLYDELLRVPLILRGPGVPASRITTPVSLLDLAPTVLDLLGLPAQDLPGRSLLPLAQGDPTAAASQETRPQSVGRPLYGADQWGVVLDGKKWTTKAGRESLYDLVSDPDEQEDLARNGADTTAWHSRLGEGLGTWSGPVLRLEFGAASRKPAAPLVVELSNDAGFTNAWLGGDPMNRAPATAEVTEAGIARITFDKGAKGRREAYVRANGDLLTLAGLTLRFVNGDTGEVLATHERTAETLPEPDGRKHVLLRGAGGRRSATVTYGIVADPPANAEAIQAFDSEVEEALKALGYVE